MKLYSIYEDSDTYRTLGFDSNQMFEEYGSLINHFNVNFMAKSFAEKMKKPLNVTFSREASEFSGDEIPDISEHYGRLYLNQKAYEVVKDIIKNDGEFLPVICDGEPAYIFNTLSLADNVDGLDKKLSIRNSMGDLKNVSFHNEKIKKFMIFKTKFDNFLSAYCQESLKNAIESAELKGVFFTPDLGNRLSKPTA